MKVIRGDGIGLEIDFSRPIKHYEISGTGKGFGIPIKGINGLFPEIYFWDHETIRATVGKDRYELAEDNPYAYEQLKNNVELLFALHGL